MIRSYVITHDYGFAPNYDQPALTLACCKPQIRKHAKIGDWVVGTLPRKRGWNLLCFAGHVSDAMDFDSYFNDPEFSSKRPTSGNSGDAIYHRNAHGKLVPVRNRHHTSEQQHDHDNSVDRILVCRRYWHFPDGLALPDIVADKIVKRGPGHRHCSEPSIIAAFENFIDGYPAGGKAAVDEILAKPCRPCWSDFW